MAKRKEPQLTAQLYTLRDHLKEPKQVGRTLKRVRKIGYRNVQLSGIGPIDPLDLRKILDDAGVKAVGHHTNMGQLRNDLVGLIDELHVYGCEYTAVAFLPEEERKTGAAWKKRAKEMTKFGKELAKEGITLQYHNHSFEFMRFKVGKTTKTGLEILYTESDPKALQAEIDTFWVAHGGGEPSAWCEAMKGRLDQVHLKDGMVHPDGKFWFTEVGEGNLDWPRILKACQKAKTKHYIVEQDANWVGNNPFKSLEVAYNNLRKLGLR